MKETNRLSLVDGSRERVRFMDSSSNPRLSPVYAVKKETQLTLEGDEDIERLVLVGFRVSHQNEEEI